MSSPAAISPERTHISVRRYFAHYIDSLLFAVAAFLLSAPFLLISEVLWIVAIVLLFTVGQVYFFAWVHKANGTSPGKRLLSLRVVDAQGGVPPWTALVKRSVPLPIEYFYIIAFVGMMSSDYRQRFGDRWAGTYVVRT